MDENANFEVENLRNQKTYLQETTDFHDAIFLSNHDQNRVLSVLDGNLSNGKLAASILLTLPGTPYLYYGEEIGMLGIKPDPNIQEPFLWEIQTNDSLRTNWIIPEFTIDNTVVPLAAQSKDKN